MNPPGVNVVVRLLIWVKLVASIHTIVANKGLALLASGKMHVGVTGTIYISTLVIFSNLAFVNVLIERNVFSAQSALGLQNEHRRSAKS